MAIPIMDLSDHELGILDIMTRVVSCLSMVSACFTVTSYLSCRALRTKPFNRIGVLMASTNICGSLAYSWGSAPIFAGRNSAFCQTQGFMILWFVTADPFLVFIMAASVWFRICSQQDIATIHFLENIGICCALGLPFIPSLVFLCWRPNGLTVYGPAGEWCWISAQSNELRIYAGYAPIWASLLCAVFLFILSGSRIMRTRAEVRRAQSIYQSQQRTRKSSVISFGSHAWYNTRRKTSSEGELPVCSNSDSVPTPFPEDPPTRLAAPMRVHSTPELASAPISTDSTDSAWSHKRERSISRPTVSSRRSSRFDAMHWKYARFAFLCCFVLLATWVPITIMRVYNNFINPKHPTNVLYYPSAVCVPLQGIGNFLVYITLNWAECQAWMASLISVSCLKRCKRTRSSESDESTGG